jgi:recombinational DNA repair ATPase RecF
MIASFQLKFGRAPGLDGEPISASPVVVFVGSNNSGKSKVLTEIEAFCGTAGTRLGAVSRVAPARPEVRWSLAVSRTEQHPNATSTHSRTGTENSGRRQSGSVSFH